MASATQYVAVAKIPVRNQTSSIATTAMTAAIVSTVCSGTARLSLRLVPALDHVADGFVRQKSTDRNNHKEHQFL
jgi:hypothetical protein